MSSSADVERSGRIAKSDNDNWKDIEVAGEAIEDSLADALFDLSEVDWALQYYTLMRMRDTVSRGLGVASIFICNTDIPPHLRYIRNRSFLTDR